MRVLALDLSSTSGAAFDGVDGKPQFSTHKGRMPDDDDFGAFFGALAKWVRDLIAFQRPDLIAIEAPFVPLGNTGRPTSPRIVYALVGLAAVAETVANAHSIPTCKPAVASVRKHFTGSGRAKKPDVERRCYLLGWSPRDNHQADAAALFCYAKSVHDPKWAPTGTLLFARTA
jgi:Holliday junction resolvasome RuvABC endonuclease subunit